MAGKKFDTSKSVWGELANNVDIMKHIAEAWLGEF